MTLGTSFWIAFLFVALQVLLFASTISGSLLCNIAYSMSATGLPRAGRRHRAIMQLFSKGTSVQVISAILVGLLNLYLSTKGAWIVRDVPLIFENDFVWILGISTLLFGNALQVFLSWVPSPVVPVVAPPVVRPIVPQEIRTCFLLGSLILLSLGSGALTFVTSIYALFNRSSMSMIALLSQVLLITLFFTVVVFRIFSPLPSKRYELQHSIPGPGEND